MSNMPKCTSCGEPCDNGSSYIAVIEEGGQLSFRWGCEHHQVWDAVFYLGSESCMRIWLAKHQDYQFMMFLFLDKTKRQHIC